MGEGGQVFFCMDGYGGFSVVGNFYYAMLKVNTGN